MNLIEGTFIRRENRFVASVEAAGQNGLAHVPNTGRMRELLTPGRKIFLLPSQREERKTAYTLKLVDMGEFLVSIDSGAANQVVYNGLKKGELAGLTGYRTIIPEFTHGRSRFDFYLAEPGECFLEVKSVTLVEEGIARFPDAPTERGRKHLEHLLELKEKGARAGVIFLVQRADALSFEPNYPRDPDFSRALKEASLAGVEVWAYLCKVSKQCVRLDKQIPVIL